MLGCSSLFSLIIKILKGTTRGFIESINLKAVGNRELEVTMYTLRADLLKALGIHYDTASEFLVLRGKLYKRGPSFPKYEYRKATKYCQKGGKGKPACLLVESFAEFTVWLETSNSSLPSAQRVEQSPLVVSDKQLAQHCSKREIHLSYRSA